MPTYFIATVTRSATATARLLDVRHWLLQASSEQAAEKQMKFHIINVNRSIPSVTNALVTITPKLNNNNVCIFLARGLNCQGHPTLTPLKTERSGNEGPQT